MISGAKSSLFCISLDVFFSLSADTLLMDQLASINFTNFLAIRSLENLNSLLGS